MRWRHVAPAQSSSIRKILLALYGLESELTFYIIYYINYVFFIPTCQCGMTSEIRSREQDKNNIPYGLNESKKLTFYKRSKCVFIHIFFRFRYSFIREICLFQLVPATFYVARLVIHFVILRSFFNSSFDGWMSILFLISRERFPFIYSVYLNVSEQRFGAGRCPGGM